MKKAKGIAATKAVMPFDMEGAKMLEVYLLKRGAHSAAKLSLPATDYALLDALDKVGITNERDIYHVEVANSKLDFLFLFHCSHSLYLFIIIQFKSLICRNPYLPLSYHFYQSFSTILSQACK